jgi:hypothetical protein
VRGSSFGDPEVTHKIRVATPPSRLLNADEVGPNLLQKQLTRPIAPLGGDKFRHCQHGAEAIQAIQNVEVNMVVIAYSSLQQRADGAPIEKRSPTNSLKQMLMKVWANLFWDGAGRRGLKKIAQ